MNIYTPLLLDNNQQDQLMQLWNKEYPEQLAFNSLSEFRSYLKGLTNIKHYLLMDNPGTIKGWAFTFVREADRWFALILDSTIQYQGHGTRLLNRLKQDEKVLNGWATDHDRYTKRDKGTYKSPIVFYLKNGFMMCEDIRLETEKISAVKIRWDNTNGR